MRRQVSLYLRDILHNMSLAQEFLHGLSQQDLENDNKTLYAVLRSIEVIGEAAKHVSPETRERYSGVPWKEMAGMRDKLIHDNIGVDVETVWLVVKDRLPAIRPMIAQALQELERQEQ